MELSAAYLTHAQQHYRRRDGTTTPSLCRVRTALGILRRLYGFAPVVEFGPLQFQAVRQTWIEEGLARKTVNDYAAQVKTIFAWGVSRGLVPPMVHHALLTVPQLEPGRSAARETAPKLPVPQGDIDAIRPHVSTQVWALVQLQLLTGARGGELLKLRSTDFDTGGPVWLVTPEHHKTAHRGKGRVLLFGPQAQTVLAPFMAGRAVDRCLFSPREAVAELMAREADCRRRPNQPQSPRKTLREVGEHYTPASYRKAVERACVAAGVPSWSPHRLRHNAGTTIRREGGIEAARLVLGLSDGATTAIYAERDLSASVELMNRIG